MNRLPTRASAAVAAVLLAVLTSLATFLAPATADSGPGSGDGSGHGSGHGNGHGNDNGGHGHGNSHLASIPLPNGFNPEDITNGPHHSFFVGSVANGAIYQGNYRSTTGSIFAPATANGAVTTGLYVQKRRGHDYLWAAGGPSGEARVYDVSTGKILQTWQLAPANTGAFISDVIVSRTKAYYSDAFKQQLYVIDLATGAVTVVPLSGLDLHYQPNGAFNLNGLALFGHDQLVSAQTATGQLFAIDPTTGKTTLIPLTDKRTGAAVTIIGADGIAQRGNKLYVAQNFLNKVATVKVNSHLDGARLIAQVTDPALDFPSSVEQDRGNLWALNARFESPNTLDKTYSLTRLDKK